MSAKFRDVLNVYEFSCVLPGTGEEILFKPLTTGQLKKLLTYEGETNPIVQEQAIDELLNASITTEGFDIYSMYLEDRFFLLIQIRKKSKGEVLEFAHNCTKCNSQTLHRVNLNDLPIIQKKDADPIVELGGGIKVELKHVTRAEYTGLDPKLLKGMTETQAAAEMQIYLNAIGVVSIETKEYGVETELTTKDKKYLLENIPTTGFEKIRQWNDDNFFGVDFNKDITCIKCRNIEKIQIPLEGAFFL